MSPWRATSSRSLCPSLQVTAELQKLESQRASSAEGSEPLRKELRRLEAQVLAEADALVGFCMHVAYKRVWAHGAPTHLRSGPPDVHTARVLSA